MSGPAEVFVSLLGEQVEVTRPVLAEHIHGDVYKIAEQQYDRGVETWQFEPGDEVVCQLVESNGGQILAAMRRAD